MKGAPLTGIQGNPLEPAVSLGDYVRGFILQAPFAWRWNRATTTFNTLANGTQDYVKLLPTFGWLESASVNDGKSGPNSIVSIENRLNLTEDLAPSQPRYVSARLDDNAGNITFRVMPAPDAVYTVTVTYQLAAPTFTNLSDTWSPLPDYMRNMYEMGFRAFAWDYFDDPRFLPAFQMFLRQLLSVSEGLDSTQKNLFLQQFIDMNKQGQGVLSGQISRQARGGY